MSLLRLAMLWSVTCGIQVTMTQPSPPPSASERIQRRGMEIVTEYIPILSKSLFWLGAFAETISILTTRDDSGEAPPIRIMTPLFIGWLMNFVGAFLRIACYRTLGQQFTFALSIRENHRLITSGPYAYVRHPSYIGALFTGVGAYMYHLSPGSWVGDRIHRWLAPSPDSPHIFEVGWLGWLVWAGVFVIHLVLFIRPRMQKEDAVLKKNFGAEWERWEKKVPYWLVPGVY